MGYCKDCKWWDGLIPRNVNREDTREGYCILASPGHENLFTRTLAYASGHTGEEFLITRPEFGCVQFKEMGA